MRKFLIVILFVFCCAGVVYAASRRPSKKTTSISKTAPESKDKAIVDIVCDPKDPSCSSKAATKIERSCGRGGRPLRVAGMIGNAPFGWVEADKGTHQNMQSYGLGRVVLGKIAKELKFRFVSVAYTSQEAALEALKKGEIDMHLGLYKRYASSKEIDVVSPGYFTNYFTVYFKKGKELPVESYQDLVGLKGVVRQEELIYPLIYQRLPKGVSIQVVLSAPEVFKMLMNDEVDYILASPYALEGELRRYKMQNDIVSDGVVLDSAALSFAFSKNSSCFPLKDEISGEIRRQGFSQKTLNDDIRRLIDDWGERFRSDEVLMKTLNNTLPENMSDDEPDSSDN